MAEHRVPMLGSGLRRHEDPARSHDPRIRELVTALATLEPAPAPRAHFRAELRAQLVAVAPRLVAEGTAVELRPSAERTDAVAQAEKAAAAPARRRVDLSALRRPLGVVVGAFAVFALMLGGAIVVSKKALPGDALYALKRANENVQLSMTHGTDRGRTYLQFASRRADEVRELLSHADATALAAGPTAGSGVSGHTADLVRSTLDSADDDLRNGTALLTAQAVRDGSAGPLDVISGWAPGQLADLKAIADRIPAGDLRTRAAHSAQLVQAALTRAGALRSTLDCSGLDEARTDALGPIPPTVCNAPATIPSTPKPGASTSTVAPKPGSTSAPRNGSTVVIPGVTSGGATSAAAPAPATTSGSPSATLPVPLPGLPGLPSSASVGPITVDSCGVSVSLGPIGLGLGGCTSSGN